MSKQYYECHVTMHGKPEVVRPLVEAIGWKFSAIDGDPSLGDGVKCYATRHYNERLDATLVRDNVLNAAASLVGGGVEVVRRKVELVIYDDRSSTIDLA